MSLHQRRTHPTPIEGCWACRIGDGPAVAAAARPTRAASKRVISADRREQSWNRDMPAYKRLRDQGLQPKAIDGSAEMEQRASTRFEIESGHVYDRQGEQSLLRDAVNTFEDTFETGVFEPATTPKPPLDAA